MKLVESEIPHEDAAPVRTPPRPERRRVSVSLALTLTVLVATVATVYAVFPERHNALLTRAVASHRSPAPLELEGPSDSELRAWTVGVLGEPVPWPEGAGRVLGARQLSILGRPAAYVRYRIGGQLVSVIVQHARDAPPRFHRRERGELVAVSWRQRGPWTFAAVGPARAEARWRDALDTP